MINYSQIRYLRVRILLRQEFRELLADLASGEVQDYVRELHLASGCIDGQANSSGGGHINFTS